jgi:hypothetical protein
MKAPQQIINYGSKDEAHSVENETDNGERRIA